MTDKQIVKKIEQVLERVEKYAENSDILIDSVREIVEYTINSLKEIEKKSIDNFEKIQDEISNLYKIKEELNSKKED